VAKKVKELGLNVKAIVVTHTHPDHIGAVKAVKEATKGELSVHGDEAAGLSSGGHPGMPSSGYSDRLLKGGDSIKAGSISFLVVHTPGHSPGGICLLGEGVVFTATHSSLPA